MRKLITVLSLIMLSFSVYAAEVGSIIMPDTLQIDGQELVLNGAGIRSRFVLDLYVAGLYLTAKEADAKKIIASTAPMALRLHIISSKITSKKMIKATRDGFNKATSGKMDAIESEIEQFLSAFDRKIRVGDVFEFVSLADGVTVSKNGEQQLTIASVAFKQALFGIWLSKKPVKFKLKNELLGNI